jgi:tetratricopeptide (TPR) repeat protein
MEEVQFHEPARGLLQLRRTLRESGPIRCTAFDVALATYWERAYPTEDVNQALDDILADRDGVLATVADNAPAWLALGEQLPAGLGLGVKALNYVRRKSKEWGAKRTVEALQGLELLDSTQVLARLPYFLGLDLCTHLKRDGALPPVIFIDTYEALWSDRPDRTGLAAAGADAWVRELVAAAPGVLFVILGRERLGWDRRFPDDWAGYLDDSHLLGGLADADADRFLEQIPIPDPQVRAAIIEGAKGDDEDDDQARAAHGGPGTERGALPFYLDLAVDTYLLLVADGRTPQPGDFGRTHPEVLVRFLRHLGTAEQETLKVLAAPRAFDRELFAALVDRFGTRYPLTAFPDFVGFSFIEQGADGRYRLHGLMRDHLDSALDADTRAELESFLFEWFDARCQPASPREVTAAHEAALGEAVYHRDLAEAEQALAWFWERWEVFYEAACYPGLEPLCRWTLNLAEARFGPDHPETAVALNNLAQLLQATNRLTEAEPLMRRALAIDEASNGPAHPDVARNLNNIAGLLQTTNRLFEAEPLMCRALAIDEVSYGPMHPRVAIQLNNLAQLLQATNRLPEAELLMRRALAIDEASYGLEHSRVATDLSNLAQLLQATNRMSEAEPLLRRGLAILLSFTRQTGHKHPNLRVGFGNYLSLLEALSLSAEKVAQRLAELAPEAGYTPDEWLGLLRDWQG